MKKSDKILYFDIETSPCLAYVWDCGKQYVSAAQIKKERKIICISYMWEGETSPTSLRMNLKKHKLNHYDDDADRELLVKFSKIYNQANLVVAHNGRRFDIARIRARLAKFGLPDLAPVLIDDSYKMFKNIDFTSHKLDYLGKFFGVGRKTDTTYSLWMEVMEGSEKALNKMCHYCNNDVKLLQQVYRKVRPYGKSQLNLAILREDNRICPACGEDGLTIKKQKFSATLGKRIQYQCKCCGSHCTRGTNEISNPSSYPRKIR